jgi:hypothetical protein
MSSIKEVKKYGESSRQKGSRHNGKDRISSSEKSKGKQLKVCSCMKSLSKECK